MRYIKCNPEVAIVFLPLDAVLRMAASSEGVPLEEQRDDVVDGLAQTTPAPKTTVPVR